MISARWVVEVEVEGEGEGAEERRDVLLERGGEDEQEREEGEEKEEEEEKGGREVLCATGRAVNRRRRRRWILTPGFRTAPHSSTERSAQESDPIIDEAVLTALHRSSSCIMSGIVDAATQHLDPCTSDFDSTVICEGTAIKTREVTVSAISATSPVGTENFAASLDSTSTVTHTDFFGVYGNSGNPTQAFKIKSDKENTLLRFYPSDVEISKTNKSENNASWRPQLCQECTCYSDVAICRPIHCPNPQCDFQKGERLRIPANKCCPECISSSQGSCQYEGVVYGLKQSLSLSSSIEWPLTEEAGLFRLEIPLVSPPCMTASGVPRHALCVFAPEGVYPATLAHAPLSPALATRACSRQLESAAPSVAVMEGTVYRDGEEWKPSLCSRCGCSNGEVQCSVAECQQVACKPGQTKVKRANQCCDECAAAKGSCLYEDAVRYNGDMWNSTGCEFCTCDRGQVLCQRAECGRVTCPQDLARWTDSGCRECECRDAQVTCYLLSCPTCPLGTLAITQEGGCCPECRQGILTRYAYKEIKVQNASIKAAPCKQRLVSKLECHADCLSCLGTPDQCESCRDPKAFLHHGRCLSVCPAGYYAEGRECAACQSSCATCSSKLDCLSCGSQLPLLSADSGQCLASCPPGSFQHDHTHCRRCHKSCSECRGPSQQECVSCSDPAALLKDGECVPDCGTGFFSQEGVCYACDSSCASCFPDNPKCMSCVPGTALHHGKCISQCPLEHYLDTHSRCRDCHPSCRSCVGPLASDCLRCLKPEEALLPQFSHLQHGVCTAGCPAHSFLDHTKTCRGEYVRFLRIIILLYRCGSVPARSVISPAGSVLDHLQTTVRPAPPHPACMRATAPPAACKASSTRTAIVKHATHPARLAPVPHRLTAPPAPRWLLYRAATAGRAAKTGIFSMLQLESASSALQIVSVVQQTSRRASAVFVCGVKCRGPGCWAITVSPTVPRATMAGMEPASDAIHHVMPAVGQGLSHVLPAPQTAFCCPRVFVLPNVPLVTMTTVTGSAKTFMSTFLFSAACDSQCLTCDMAGVCTSCRDPSKVLLFGECQYDSCAHQYYLNTTTRACRECDWSCNACKGPLRTDCLLCMEGYVLQEGVCTQGCSPGSYRDGDKCLGCDDHCMECNGPGQCQQCQPPYATLQGQCVLECGRNYFLDVSSQVCKPCSSDCVLCDGVGRCKACRDQTYLMEGYCTPDCGHGYYADQKTRICHVNTHPPALHINGSLLIPLGGFAPLPQTLLQVKDPDSPSERLIFQLVQGPSNGQLYLFKREEGEEREGHEMSGRELTRDDTFTWEDLRTGRVRFRHQKDQTRTGEFSLRVADPQLFSQPETIRVQAVSMQPPRIVTLAPLPVEGRGALATITKLVLQVDDPDNPADVLVMILEPPRHGRLTRLHSDRALSRFKLEELSREQIQYIHDGSEGTEDGVVLQINDGHSYKNILLQVHINQKAADSPHMPSVLMTWVKEGGMVRLDKKHLLGDYKGVSSDDIIYTIHASDGQPKYGEVVLVSMPADGPTEGWRPSLTDDRGFTPTTSFTQQDVNDGTVWYRHFGRGTNSDSFQFQVSTEVAPLIQSDTQTFTIGVLPQIPGFPQLAPDCDLQITALEDRVTEITPSAMSFIDSETPSAIEHRSRPYTPVKHFTQADVNNGKIIYRPPQAPSHLQELYQYSFIVSDGEHTTPEMDFAVLLLSNHQQPPVFQVLDPLLEVSMGGQAAIGGQQLAVSDADTAPDELEFELVEAPIHGELTKTDGSAHISMNNGDIFTFSDITRNVLLYRHTGLSTQDDAITFSVSDGISMASTVVQVVVLGAGDDGPQQDPAATLSLEVGERSSTVIRRSHLAYTDNTSPDNQIQIQLVSVPMYGILTRSQSQHEHQELREYSSFTMEDISKHRIRYITSLETGSQPVTDIFHFVVYDGDNNRLDNQMCTITITSTPRQPPVVTVRSGIKVQEGGRVQLSANHIIVSDLDTPRKDLLVWLISPPKYGFIENTKAGGSIGGSRIITPDVPFSVEDLTSDYIFYVQDSQHKTQAKQDIFSFYISDGHSQTEAFNVEIDIQQSKEDREPVVSVSSIHVEENSGVVITNSSLSVLDQDTPENEILFTIIRKPSYGKLRRRQFYSQPLENGRVLTQGSTFTYQDVLDQLLVYTPETISGGADEMGFTLTDGIFTHTGRLEFTMDVRRTEGPRMTVNRGLQLPAGSSSKITEQNLKGTDIDSDTLKLRYVLTKDLPTGKLQLNKNGRVEKISVKGPVQSFTQDDVNKGLLQYSHEKGEKGGSLSFKFNLVDPEGNKLIDQSFFISVLEDRLPPSVVVNKGLVLDENSVKKLTTLQLSASDQDSEPSELIYRITKQPNLGHLEHAASPGTRISMFTQADLASRSIQYVHTSEEEKHADQFSFTVSDGTNEVAQTFYITIKPVDDSLPLLQVPGMRVQEGVRKTITEFELKATDADTEAESIIFTVVQAPRHGTIERTSNGQHYRQTSSFTMDDIYQNRISYNHDGSNSLKDRFTFTVADGTNLLFMVEEGGKEIVTAAPQKFKIDILPVDDGTPRIVTNLGLQWLEYMENKATNLITKKELLTMDPDTDDGQLVYEITTEPKHGFLESKLKPGNSITTFTQADINLGLIRYVLHQENVQETMDNFKFLVKDSKPNVVSDNVFHIQWSLISFEHKSYNVSEKAGTVAVTVKRTGNLNQYAIVLCRTEQGSATSTSSVGSKPGQQDYVEYAGQVQFDEREDSKVCTIVINDDKVFEGTESFHVELSMPVYALLGRNTRAIVNINDTEDEPTLQFDKKIYHVNESTGFIHAPIERKGDTSSTVSALCYTVAKSAQGSSLHALESGSDYKSRGMSKDNRVIFGPGVSMSTCDVKLIDDSEYELSEEFELVLSDASDNARMGDVNLAKVVIDGPNDASTVTLGNATFTFSEDAGTIEIPVLRHGSDLSSVTSVWCATRPSDPPSASPGVDYIPSSKKVEFKPGKTEESCSLTIMDDIQNPSIEGSESFVVFLSSPQGAVLQEPYEANVVITDTFQDIPSMQFEKSAYTVKEKDSVLHIPIFRTGDLSFKSSVRCFTRTMSAMVMDDFEERRNADESRITFLKGEKVKNCTVHVNDDSVFEPEEEFQVHLGTPLGDHWSGAMVGASDIVTITITNDEDVIIQLMYLLREVHADPPRRLFCVHALVKRQTVVLAVLAGCRRQLLRAGTPAYTVASQPAPRNLPVRTFAAVKTLKKGKKEDTEKEVKKPKVVIDDKDRHKPYGKTAWAPVDDVYIMRYYPRTIYDAGEAIDMLKNFQMLDFTPHTQPVYTDLRLNMKLEKKKKVDPFVSTVHLPHPFKTEMNKVVVFTETVNRSCCCCSADVLLLLRVVGLYEGLSRHPHSQMLQLFKTGHEYMVESECYVRTQIATGSFDFPPWLRLHFWSQLDADNKANVSQTLTETEVRHSAEILVITKQTNRLGPKGKLPLQSSLNFLTRPQTKESQQQLYDCTRSRCFSSKKHPRAPVAECSHPVPRPSASAFITVQRLVMKAVRRTTRAFLNSQRTLSEFVPTIITQQFNSPDKRVICSVGRNEKKPHRQTEKRACATVQRVGPFIERAIIASQTSEALWYKSEDLLPKPAEEKTE
ncbi:Extracellular matrix protein FRAS1 [Collichthys lucidus]|uniref:Extracellular matrix protein FRAS1 n=1 Tax=Collichthys lucidus TaxID=240159 RepID=A0A4U5URY1_COLLU|nr:Extracellular matrix protein FRAS1 [Collichthys lucidus]